MDGQNMNDILRTRNDTMDTIFGELLESLESGVEQYDNALDRLSDALSDDKARE